LIFCFLARKAISFIETEMKTENAFIFLQKKTKKKQKIHELNNIFLF